MDDRELLEIIPTMESIARSKDIYPIIRECAQAKQKTAPQFGNSVSIVPAQEAVGAYTITSPLPTQVAPVAVSGGAGPGATGAGTGGLQPAKASPVLRSGGSSVGAGGSSVIASADPAASSVHVSFLPNSGGGVGGTSNTAAVISEEGTAAGIPNQSINDLENSCIANSLDSSTSNGGAPVAAAAAAASQVTTARLNITATTPGDGSYSTANSSLQSSTSYVSSGKSVAASPSVVPSPSSVAGVGMGSNSQATNSQLATTSDPSSMNNNSVFLPNSVMDNTQNSGSDGGANMPNVTITASVPAATNSK